MSINSRTQNSLRSILWGIFEKFNCIFFPFLIRTLMIYNMGLEYVGLDSLFNSILQVLNFAELGIGSALIFSMYRPLADSDLKKVGALLSLYKRLYFRVGVITLSLGLCILPFIKCFISGDVNVDVNVYILYFLFLVNNAIGYFLFSYRESLLLASQRVDVLKKITLKARLLMYSIQLIVLITIHNYYIYVVAIPLCSVVSNILVYRITNKLFSDIECKGQIDKEELDKIKKNVIAMVFQKVGNIALVSSGPIIISSYLGLVILAKYQNYYYIISAVTSILAVISVSVIPSIGNFVVSETVAENYSKFKIFNLLYVWFISICSCCLLCLSQPFIIFWIGKENLLSDNFVFLISIFFYINHFCDILAIYQESCGIWWQTRFIPFIASIVNITLNIFFVQIYSINGVLIGTLISVILVWNPGIAIALFSSYFSCIKKALFSFFRNQLYLTFVTLSALSITNYLCHLIEFKSIIIQLCFNLTVCLIVGNIILIIFYIQLVYFKDSLKFLKLCIKALRA